VHYILPDGYEGVFTIIEDAAAGVDVVAANQEYRYQVPESGVLRVRTIDSIRSAHLASASYRNGTRLPSGDAGDAPDDRTDGSQLYSLELVNEKAVKYLIGTKEQREAILQAPATDEHE
jgi:hypothetical protein